MAGEKPKLSLTFHGRVLEHLGLQIYQSAVNSVAEMVANAWDADAERVKVVLPAAIKETETLVVSDDGIGMTFEECQNRYLNVGWSRRGDNADERSAEKKRPVLGRKGIGKFAGFGIAELIRIETVSKRTGERTIFELDLNDLMGEEYISSVGKDVRVVRYDLPAEQRRSEHGTTLTLSKLTLDRAPSTGTFPKSMARRFLLHQTQDDFKILVNGKPLPEAFDLAGVQFQFPKDYRQSELPDALEDVDEHGWGTETVEDAGKLRWRFFFYKDTIDEEELRGIAVYAKGKVAQSPFFFNITGGLGGQHGVEYLSGQVEARFLDSLPKDLIATERQRIDWGHEKSAPVLAWGERRVKDLLKAWNTRRGEERGKEMEEKLSGFSARLDRLPKREARTVRSAISRVAQIPTLNDEQFNQLGSAVLTAWEKGRLKELISDMSEVETLSEADMLNILVEAEILTALNTAEAVKTKLLAVGGLKIRVRERKLENAVRDYVAENPWLVSPEWETFRKERSVNKVVRDAAAAVGFLKKEYKGRVDLVLSSGQHLLILEFMRPGLKLDWDHTSRFEQYVRTIRQSVESNTGGKFQRVTGYVVADHLENDPTVSSKIKDLRISDMYALDWDTLLANALSSWEEFLGALIERAPEDERIRALVEDDGQSIGT